MLVVSVQMNTLECVYVKLMLTSSQCLMDLCRTDVDHPAARQRCRFSVLALAPRTPHHAYRRAAYDRDGVVLVKGVLTGRKLRLAQPIVGPSSWSLPGWAKVRKALLRRPQGPG